jgi:hypothetical protein
MTRPDPEAERITEEARRRNGHAPVEVKSAKDLMGRELPPVKWAVAGVLPEGVTLLAGKPKMGFAQKVGVGY